jgi:hypothetical protein
LIYGWFTEGRHARSKEVKALLEVMQKVKVRIDAQAAGVAAYDLVQKLFLLLIERGALSVADAQVIFCDSIETQREIMDVEWTPINEAAAVLLTRLSKAVERQHEGRAGGELKQKVGRCFSSPRISRCLMEHGFLAPYQHGREPASLEPARTRKRLVAFSLTCGKLLGRTIFPLQFWKEQVFLWDIG